MNTDSENPFHRGGAEGTEKINAAQWLHEIFFCCPLTGDRQRIIDVHGSESGRVGLEITTVGPRRRGAERTAWRHRIYTEEMDPAEELKKAKRRAMKNGKQVHRGDAESAEKT